MASKSVRHIPPAQRLQPGTVCMIKRQIPGAPHDGKIVEVVSFATEWKSESYNCLPELIDPYDHTIICWMRSALIPLHGGDGLDEMLRITGKPKKIRTAAAKAMKAARVAGESRG